MKNIKKVLALLLALTMVLALAACGGSTSAPAASSSSSGDSAPAADAAKPAAAAKHVKIGVGLYQDSGAGVTALKAFLANLEKTLNVEFAYTVLSTNDEALNVTKVQELISAGCEGIIITMDAGMDAILAECRDANVYLAGYLCDFDTSFRIIII